MKKILIFLLLSILLLPSFSCLYANEDSSPFSLSIVFPMEFGAAIQVSSGNKFLEFHVVLRNISKEPQKIFEENNSWGYYNLSFEMIVEGKKILINKRVAAFDKNIPIYDIINPDGFAVFDVFITHDEWPNFPKVKHGEKAVMGELKAIYEVNPDSATKQTGVWTGRIESEPIKIVINS